MVPKVRFYGLQDKIRSISAVMIKEFSEINKVSSNTILNECILHQKLLKIEQNL